jgi:hypothetical protein
MRFLAYRQGVDGIALETRGELLGLRSDHPNYPGSLDDLVGNDEALRVAASAISQYGRPLGIGEFTYLAPLRRPKSRRHIQPFSPASLRASSGTQHQYGSQPYRSSSIGKASLQW